MNVMFHLVIPRATTARPWKVPVPAANVFRIAAENPNANRAAQNHVRTLRNFFHPASGQFPVFDRIRPGMGRDGHTASLFPDSMRVGRDSTVGGCQLSETVQERTPGPYPSRP